MSHLKRHAVDKKYPIPRKGTAYVVRPTREPSRGLPLLIVLRDVLELAQNRGEAKAILNKGEIEVNGKIRRDEKFQVTLFDILKIKSMKKIYTLAISPTKKFELNEIKTDTKTAKIIGKKIMPENKIQVNLNGGENFIVKESFKIGDSAVIDFAQKKIAKIIPIEEGKKVVVIGGKHIGQEGKILSIKEDVAEVSTDKSKVNIQLNNLMVIN